MTALKTDKMTVDEFLEWCLTQEECYELVDGIPRLKWGDSTLDTTDPHMMTGARNAHDDVVIKDIFALKAKLRGSPCKLHTDDIAIAVPRGGAPSRHFGQLRAGISGRYDSEQSGTGRRCAIPIDAWHRFAAQDRRIQIDSFAPLFC